MPARLWERLRAFLATAPTGRVRVHVVAGAVVALELVEIIRAPRGPA